MSESRMKKALRMEVTTADWQRRHYAEKGSPETRARITDETRYRLLAKVGMTKNHEVLDVGCGYGGFYKFNRDYIGAAYTGVEMLSEVVRETRVRYPEMKIKIGTFLTMDLARNYDYCVASNFFYVGAKKLPAYIEEIARKMMDVARIGIVLTFQSAQRGRPRGSAKIEPWTVLEILMGITPNVVLRHDVIDPVGRNDFAVYLYHEPQCV